jgi:5'-3' exonuclease
VVADVSRMRQALNDEDYEAKEVFDSNCITPGTKFMVRLSKNLKFFIQKKVSEDPVWQVPDIIFSGHEVPGEGEHKLMDYIRQEKSQPDYPPNLRHCEQSTQSRTRSLTGTLRQHGASRQQQFSLSPHSVIDSAPLLIRHCW